MEVDGEQGIDDVVSEGIHGEVDGEQGVGDVVRLRRASMARLMALLAPCSGGLPLQGASKAVTAVATWSKSDDIEWSTSGAEGARPPQLRHAARPGRAARRARRV